MNEYPSVAREPQARRSSRISGLGSAVRLSASLLLATALLGIKPAPVQAEDRPLSTTELVGQLNVVRTTEVGLPAYKVAKNGEEAEQQLTRVLVDMVHTGKLAAACAGQAIDIAGNKINVPGWTGEAFTCPNTERGTLTHYDQNGNVTSVVDTDPGRPWQTEEAVVNSWKSPAVAEVLFRNQKADTVVCATHDFSDQISRTQRAVLCAVYDTDGQ